MVRERWSFVGVGIVSNQNVISRQRLAEELGVSELELMDGLESIEPCEDDNHDWIYATYRPPGRKGAGKGFWYCDRCAETRAFVAGVGLT